MPMKSTVLHKLAIAFCGIQLLVVPLNAYAYLGPGLGGGVLAAVLGILGGFFMLIVGFIWYPIKRAWRWLTQRRIHD